ncbi:MAG TPA: RNA polymerase sigma factor RpoD/SigA [Flavisolibacter sp.]|nr:RNA polymerase sigma factor RpoD/SigA [Flavisolibacter sp.]
MRQLKVTQSITNRSSASLDKYLSEISKIPMITPDEEIELTQAIKSGDANAVNKLTTANLRFVVSVAKQYQFRGLSLSDLIDEGNIGLMNAAKRFDETKGFKFISYAVWWIRQSIMQAINEKARLVRLPSNRIGLGNKMQRVFSQLEQANERAPSAEEISDEMKITVDEVLAFSDCTYHYVSLDAPISEDGDNSRIDVLVDDTSGPADKGIDHNQSLHIEIKRVLGTLNKKQSDILSKFFGIGIPQPLSLREIGSHYDMSAERIRQIRDVALRQLKRGTKKELLKEYLGV